MTQNTSRAATYFAVLKANPGLSWVSYSDEREAHSPGRTCVTVGEYRIKRSHIVGAETQMVEHDVMPDGSLKLFKSDLDSRYDPRIRPFYVKPKQAGRLVWLPPYVFYWQWVPGITCAVPVKDAGGKLRGVLTADFDLNALSDFVAGVSVSEHSRVFLFTSDEVLLAHQDFRGVSGTRETAKLLDTRRRGRSAHSMPIARKSEARTFPCRQQAYRRRATLGERRTWQWTAVRSLPIPTQRQ